MEKTKKLGRLTDSQRKELLNLNNEQVLHIGGGVDGNSIRAMPERKYIFLQEVFPNGEHGRLGNNQNWSLWILG